MESTTGPPNGWVVFLDSVLSGGKHCIKNFTESETGGVGYKDRPEKSLPRYYRAGTYDEHRQDVHFARASSLASWREVIPGRFHCNRSQLDILRLV